MKYLKEIHEEYEMRCEYESVAIMIRSLVKHLCKALDVSDPEEIPLSNFVMWEERLCKYLTENGFSVMLIRNYRYYLNKLLRFANVQETIRLPERSFPTTEELEKRFHIHQSYDCYPVYPDTSKRLGNTYAMYKFFRRKVDRKQVNK